MTLTKEAATAAYAANGRIPYVLSLVNSGTTAITNLTLTDDLGAYTLNGVTRYPLAYVVGTMRYYVNGVLQTAPTVEAGPPLVISGLTVPAGGNAMVFYEAPHKLRGTLDDLCAAFGAERSITLCRELTKLHEEITKTTIGEAVRYYEQNDPRGEYVLVMAGTPAAQTAAEEVTLPDAVATARLLMAQGTPPAAAAKQAAKGTPFSKGDIYKELIAAKDEDDREEESE